VYIHTHKYNTYIHTYIHTTDEMQYVALSAVLTKAATQLAPSGMQSDFLEDVLLILRNVVEGVCYIYVCVCVCA
jgi:hypothetical protein